MKNSNVLRTFEGHQKRHAVPPRRKRLVITTHIDVPVAFYEMIRTSIALEWPNLGNLRFLVAEDLIGYPIWSQLTKDEKRMARASIAHLSQIQAIPVKVQAQRIEYPDFYNFA